MLQCVGLIHPDTVYHLPTVARHDMEQVINHLGLRTMFFYLQIEGGVHVHGNGFNLLALFAQQLEKGANGLPAITVAHPQHTSPFSIHDHSGITMAFMQSELVHHQPSHSARFKGANTGLESAYVDGLDGMPMQSGEQVDMTDGHQLKQGLNPALQSSSEA